MPSIYWLRCEYYGYSCLVDLLTRKMSFITLDYSAGDREGW